MANIVSHMTDKLRHRGPDDSGAWVDEKDGVALGHRRLSIIDLSPSGHQPMFSHDKRFAIVYNGEVYNFPALKRELEDLGQKFRGGSDTEVILAAITQWGVENAVKRFNGMFAFALWDRKERKLYLVRDRIGIKPLYYGWVKGAFVFGSELKAIRAFPGFGNAIDRNSLTLYLRHNYIPAPYSIYKDVFKLEPGHILTVGMKGEPETICYWSAFQVVEEAVAHPFNGDEEEAVEELESLLRNSIKLRMISDVPLGAFLSGGIDSTTVVSLMQAQSFRPVKTFTIGFHEEGYNEAEYAKVVANHLGTEHTELYVTPGEAMAVIPRLPEIYDEPFSDSSQIPTFLVSQLTHRHVTVSLSGDGGDELFGGYNRYFWGRNIWRKIRWLPKRIRKKVLPYLLNSLSPNALDAMVNKFNTLIPLKFRQNLVGDKLSKLADVLAVESSDAMYYGLVSHWKNPSAIVRGGSEYPTILNNGDEIKRLGNFIQRMQFLDLVTYLPDDILTKVDRASMGVSLEARVPILDHRVVEFAWRLPLDMKIRNGQGKWILRQTLYKYVLRELVERPKSGFGIPIDSWLRGPLRDWAEELIDESRLKQEGFFNPSPIRQKWAEHLSGNRNWAYYLWDVLMFQAWLEEYR